MKETVLKGICRLSLIFIFLFIGLAGKAQVTDSSKNLTDTLQQKEVDHPKVLGFIRYLPDDLWQIAKAPFVKSNLKGLGLVAASTAILIPLDDALINGVKDISAKIALSPDTRYGVAVGWGEIKIIKYPKTINAALYQLGEGGTSMFIAGGLWIYGKIEKNDRAIQTASDLTETFITMGVTTQLLKRSFGRESPFAATRKGGAWQPFPSFSAYQKNTSSYDAFPSGHLATMMATVTVLATNYPEKKWIKPVGYALIGLTGWAMMNTEVHWASDYPLALALGYVSGKITTMRHKKHHTPAIPSF